MKLVPSRGPTMQCWWEDGAILGFLLRLIEIYLHYISYKEKQWHETDLIIRIWGLQSPGKRGQKASWIQSLPVSFCLHSWAPHDPCGHLLLWLDRLQFQMCKWLTHSQPLGPTSHGKLCSIKEKWHFQNNMISWGPFLPCELLQNRCHLADTLKGIISGKGLLGF